MITVKYIGTTTRLTDNTSTLFEELLQVIAHADGFASVTIDNKDTEITVHIKPSDAKFKQDIVNNLLYINKQKRQYRIHFSKSLAISSTISFTISGHILANIKSIT